MNFPPKEILDAAEEEERMIIFKQQLEREYNLAPYQAYHLTHIIKCGFDDNEHGRDVVKRILNTVQD